MDYLSHAQRDKLELALPKLKLLIWLDKKGLYDFQHILGDKGYTDLHSLAEMDIKAVMLLALHIKNFHQHQKFLQALDELRQEAKADLNFDGSTSQTGIGMQS